MLVRQGFTREEGFKHHRCAACEGLLPDDDTTGWENWLYLGPGGDDSSVLTDRLFSLVHWGWWVDKKMIWKGVYGSFLPLCKSCMEKFIQSLRDENVYKTQKEENSQQFREENLEWAKGKGKISYFQAAHNRLEAEYDMSSKQDGAIIAGLLRQQLMKMAPNARDSSKKEAMAKQETNVADEMAGQLQGLQLDDAGNTNEEKDDAGNTTKEKDNAGNTDVEM